jgi:hypothetical protein
MKQMPAAPRASQPRTALIMVSVSRILVASVVLALSACSGAPQLDAETLRSIAAEADGLLARHSSLPASSNRQAVQPDEWPETIARLMPESVFVTRNGVLGANNNGLYIEMGGYFVTESGYFVPADKSEFRPSPGTDPSYEFVGEGVYCTRSKAEACYK